MTVGFCTDPLCTPVTTDERGNAVFTGEPVSYHVQIVNVPDGMTVDGDVEFTVGPYTQTIRIPLK